MFVTMLANGTIPVSPTIDRTYPAGWSGDVPDVTARKWIKDKIATGVEAMTPPPAADPTPPPTPAPAPGPRTRATATPPAV